MRLLTAVSFISFFAASFANAGWLRVEFEAELASISSDYPLEFASDEVISGYYEVHAVDFNELIGNSDLFGAFKWTSWPLKQVGVATSSGQRFAGSGGAATASTMRELFKPGVINNSVIAQPTGYYRVSSGTFSTGLPLTLSVYPTGSFQVTTTQFEHNPFSTFSMRLVFPRELDVHTRTPPSGQMLPPSTITLSMTNIAGGRGAAVFDITRLTVVPEPGSLGLLLVAASVVATRRNHRPDSISCR